MTEGDHTRIVRWLRQVLTGSELPDRIMVRHITIEDRQTEISAIGLQDFVPNEPSLVALGDDISATILSDATGLGGIQRYLVVACLGDALISRLPIRQVASEVRIGDPVDSEPATAQGLLAQLMRHNEAQARLFAGAMGQIVSNMGDTIERQKIEIDKGDEIRVEALNRVEGLISQEHVRNLEILKEQNRAKRLQSAVGFAMNLAPFVANRVLGKKVFSEPETSPLTSLLRQFSESLSDDQRSKLLGMLSPFQSAVVQQLFAAVLGGAVPSKTAQSAPAEPAPPTAEAPQAGDPSTTEDTQ